MSTQPVTMTELELEHAELLPNRETLHVSTCHPSSDLRFTQGGFGNTAQTGLVNVAHRGRPHRRA